MSQKIASLYAEISVDATKAQSGLKGFKDSLGGMGSALSGIGAAVGIVTAGAYAVGKAWDATGGQAIRLAQSVDDVMRVTGMTAEESSKLVAITDVLGVSMGTMSMAAKTMAQQGLAPTIDTLAGLSDQFNAIQDPAAKTTFLIKEFGRSGMQMGEMMEKGGAQIKALGQQAEAMAPILSEKDVQAAKALGIEMGFLKEKVESVRVGIGNALVPELLGLIAAADGTKEPLNRQERAMIGAATAATEANTRIEAMRIASLGLNAQLAIVPPGWIQNTWTIHHTANQTDMAGLTAAEAELQRQALLHAALVQQQAGLNALGTGMASGGDLPSSGLVSVGEAGEEGINIRGGKATVIPHNAWKWMKAAGIAPGQGFRLDEGGGTGVPAGGGGYTNTGAIGGLKLDNGDSIVQRLSGGGGGATINAGAIASQAASAAAAGVSATIPGAVTAANTQTAAAIAHGQDRIVEELKGLRRDLPTTLRDAIQQIL